MGARHRSVLCDGDESPKNVAAVVAAGLTGLHHPGMDDVLPHLDALF